jgi:hypothetical protein
MTPLSPQFYKVLSTAMHEKPINYGKDKMVNNGIPQSGFDGSYTGLQSPLTSPAN